VGEVRLRGVMLCEPCGHLAKLTHDTVRKALVHRGGLRCDIVGEGLIRVGDAVTKLE
jgi:MOSC domain-containing protein YiiM